jgi:hypothetical protein
MFYLMAKNMIQDLSEQNKQDFLFLHNDVYTYKLDFELSIIASYVNHTEDMHIIYANILDECTDESTITILMSNLKFYVYHPTPNHTHVLSDNIELNGRKYRSSSCSFYGDIMNVRYVNYFINEKGQYLDCDDQIITINQCNTLKTDFSKETLTHIYPEEIEKNNKYAGIEDIRLFKYNDEIMYLGTGLHKNGYLGMIYGKYPIQNKIDLTPDGFNIVSSQCEKNWVVTGDGSEIIYKWYPMQIGIIVDDKCVKVREMDMPRFFTKARGSTNGVIYNNECWYVIHFVSYESPRYYYHCIVVFDKNTTMYLRHSVLFKLSNEPIEYCIGFEINLTGELIMGYSEWDRETKISIIQQDKIKWINKYGLL